MAENFMYEDILNTLIELEIRGGALYEKLSETAQTMEARNLFKFLAGQEDNHRKIYMGLKKATYERETLTEEYRGYLNALLDQAFQSLLEVEAESHNMATAVIKAKHIEMETLVLLSEFKRLIPESQHTQIDPLMDEERRHLKLLYDLEKTGFRG